MAIVSGLDDGHTIEISLIVGGQAGDVHVTGNGEIELNGALESGLSAGITTSSYDYSCTADPLNNPIREDTEVLVDCSKSIRLFRF